MDASEPNLVCEAIPRNLKWEWNQRCYRHNIDALIGLYFGE